MTKSNTKLTNDSSRPAERGNKKHPRHIKKAWLGVLGIRSLFHSPLYGILALQYMSFFFLNFWYLVFRHEFM